MHRWRLAPGLAALLGLLACGEAEPPAAPVDPRPDLHLVGVHMDLMAKPDPALVVEIRNLGAGAAQGFDGRCVWTCHGSVYNTGLRVVEDGILGPLASSTFSIDAPLDGFGCPGPPPVLELTCEIDDRREIEEVNEHNNGWSGTVRLTW